MKYKIVRIYQDELLHWGIKGQKWGVRRYENEDGTLTEAGKSRYKRGKELEKELVRNTNKEYVKNQSKSKMFQKLDTDPKYDNDGDAINKLEELDAKLYKRAKEKATKDLINKYGDQSIKDIEHYNKVKDRRMKVVKFIAGTSLAAAVVYNKAIKK